MSRVFRVTLSALLALCLSPFSSLAFADEATDSESQYQEEDLQQDDNMPSDDLDVAENAESAENSEASAIVDPGNAVATESEAEALDDVALDEASSIVVPGGQAVLEIPDAGMTDAELQDWMRANEPETYQSLYGNQASTSTQASASTQTKPRSMSDEEWNEFVDFAAPHAPGAKFGVDYNIPSIYEKSGMYLPGKLRVVYADGTSGIVSLPEGQSLRDGIAEWVLKSGIETVLPIDNPNAQGGLVQFVSRNLDTSDGEAATGTKASKAETLAAVANWQEDVDYEAGKVLVVLEGEYTGATLAVLANALGLPEGSVKVDSGSLTAGGKNQILVLDLPEGMTVLQAMDLLWGAEGVNQVMPSVLLTNYVPEGEPVEVETPDEESATAVDSVVPVLQDSAAPSESQVAIVEQHAIEMNVVNGDLGSVDVVANADGTPATLDPAVGDTVTLRAARADASGKLVRMSCTYIDPKTGEEITRGLERQGSWDPDSNDYAFVMPAEKATINVEWARA